MKIPTGRGFIDRKTGEITVEYVEGDTAQLDAFCAALFNVACNLHFDQRHREPESNPGITRIKCCNGSEFAV